MSKKKYNFLHYYVISRNISMFNSPSNLINNTEIILIEYKNIKSKKLKSLTRNLSKISNLFIAKIDQEEVGIMMVDYYEPPLPLFVYYIYVKSKYRNFGIGTKLLHFAENIAKERGNTSLVLQPKEVEKDIPLDVLLKWYTKNGYTRREGDPSRLEKYI